MMEGKEVSSIEALSYRMGDNPTPPNIQGRMITFLSSLYPGTHILLHSRNMHIANDRIYTG